MFSMKTLKPAQLVEYAAKEYDQLIEESLQEKPDAKKIESIALGIGSRQAAIEQKMALYFHELANVCTPEQRDSLKIVLERVSTRRHHSKSEQ